MRMMTKPVVDVSTLEMAREPVVVLRLEMPMDLVDLKLDLKPHL